MLFYHGIVHRQRFETMKAEKPKLRDDFGNAPEVIVSSEARIKELEEHNSHLSEGIRGLEKKLAESKAKIKELEKELKLRENVWKYDIKKDAKELDSYLKSEGRLQSEIESLIEINDKLEKKLAEKGREIAELKSHSRDFWKAEAERLKKEKAELIEAVSKLNVQNVLTDEFGYELGTLEINIGVAIKEKVLELLEEK
jgi:chromosome segregation ATPase